MVVSRSSLPTRRLAPSRKGRRSAPFRSLLANGLTATYFTELSGLAYSPSTSVGWSSSNGLAFSDTSSAPPINGIDTWGFETSAGSTQVLLATAGSPVPGSGHPQFMILPSSGTAGTGDSLSDSGSNHFDPFIIGPATFDISALGVSSSTNLTNGKTLSSGWDITDVTVSFGTGPDSPSPFDTTGTNTPPVGGPAPSVPEPMSVVVWSVGAFCCGALALVRRRRNKALCNDS